MWPFLGVCALLFAAAVSAQYPNLIYDTSITLNTCYSDTDCQIYLLQNASYANLNLRCNPATSRCEISTGQAVGPAFDITCPGITIAYEAWDSAGATGLVGRDYLNDGLIILTLTFPSPVFTGILRLYEVPAGMGWSAFAANISSGNIMTPYFEQQYVNSPTTRFFFRNLPALTSNYVTYGGFGIAYFDKSGCTVLAPTLIVLHSIYETSYFGPGLTVTPPVFPSNVLVLPGALVQTDLTLRTGFVALPGTYAVDYSTVTRWRCVYGQAYDMTGRPFESLVGNDFVLPPNGLYFPQGVYRNLTLADNYAYGALSGFVTLQIGVGYCSRILGNVTILQNELGVFEGIWAASLTLNLSRTDPEPPPVYVSGTNQTFNQSLLYYRLNLVQFNTLMIREGSLNPFGPIFNNNVDFTVTPLIRVVTNITAEVIDTYSICNVPYAYIDFDYSGLGLSTDQGVGTLAFVSIDLTTPNLAETTIDTAPLGGLFITGYFTASTPGFYCLVYIYNLIDGLGTRPVLRSCFQVGILAAAATQLRSFYNTGVFNENTFPYTTYAGYGSYVQTEVYLYTPPFLIITPGIDVAVQLYRFSPVPIDEAQILNYGASYADLFTDTLGDPLPLLANYVAVLTDGNTTVYQRVGGPFNRMSYPIFSYNGAADVQTAATLVQLQFYYPAILPAYMHDDYTPQNNQYVCSTASTFTVIADMTLKARVNITQPVCQGQLAEVFLWADGGFCLAVTNPYLGALGNASPYAEPCSYFYSFYNVADPTSSTFLYGGENAYIYAAPANTPLRGVVTDLMGDIAWVDFDAESLVPPDSTSLAFLPPVPACVGLVNGSAGTQEVTWEFVVSGVVNIVVPNPDGPGNITIDAITGWEPLDVLAAALYNPNNPTTDLPQYCPLLQNMTEYEVYVLCHGKNSTIDPTCAGCTNLPVAYEGAQGQTFTTAKSGWWEAYAWVPSTFYNEETGRFVYCRYALSVHIQVPELPFLNVLNLRRITVNGTQCSGTECAAIDIYTYVDPNFPSYQPMLQLTPTPPFGSSVGVTTTFPPFTNVSHVVALGQTYQLALTLDTVFCPVVTSYQVNTIGPVILFARTTRSQCQSPSGTAVLYAQYSDPSHPAGTTADVCLFWPLYPTQFFKFTLPMNQNEPTALPFAPDFFASENVTTFPDVSAGLQTVAIYDNCPGAINCNIDCNAPNLIIDQSTIQINPELEYQIFQFSVEQFNQPGGGLVISLDSAYYPPCYGGTYNFTFSVFDDLGENNAVYGPYEWFWYEPFTNKVLGQSPTCFDGGAPLLPGPPEVNFKVNVFNATVTIPTGTQYGFRQDGEYRFVVTNCNSLCTLTYPVPVQMVNPFDVVLSAGPARCYGMLGSISYNFGGGTPFQPGTLSDGTYYPAYGDGYLPDNKVVIEAQYITYWCTPANPINCIRTRLPTQVQSGNYSVILEDANGCKSPRVNVTVPSPPPIIVTLAGVAVPCATSTYATYEFIVAPNSGNGPPYAVRQNLTTVVVGQNISLDFVSALNKTVCFDVVDKDGCSTVDPICELTPSPEPVSVQLALYPSCPNQATGIAVATSNNTGGTLTCEWSSNGAVFSRAGCTQTGIPPGISLSVTMTTLNGCTGQAFGTIGARPPITIQQDYRSANGVLGGPCIDYANFTIGGGVGGPNYTVFLIGDTTGANLTYNRNYTALVTGMCRGVQYIIAAADSDGLCVETFYSLDPTYTFGGNGTVVQYPIGLPPFSFSSGTDGTVALVIVLDPAEIPPQKEPPYWQQIWPLFLFLALALAGVITLFIITSPPSTSKPRRAGSV